MTIFFGRAFVQLALQHFNYAGFGPLKLGIAKLALLMQPPQLIECKRLWWINLLKILAASAGDGQHNYTDDYSNNQARNRGQ